MEPGLDYERRLTETEQRARSNTKRLDKLEESTEAIGRMAVSMERMAIHQNTMSRDVSKLTEDVETLKAEPANRWRLVTEKALVLLTAALLGFLLARLGL